MEMQTLDPSVEGGPPALRLDEEADQEQEEEQANDQVSQERSESGPPDDRNRPRPGSPPPATSSANLGRS